MKIFSDYLKEKNVSEKLSSVLKTLVLAIKDIAFAVDGVDSGKAGTKNVYGEEQLALDVLSDRIIQKRLEENFLVGLVCSEEMEGERRLSEGKYAVCHDPLDGSSLVDVNLSVGTIIGIYEAKSFIGVKGDEQVAAMIGIYGPSTTILLTVRNGVAKFTLNKEGEFVFCGEGFKVGDGKMFAPGNLRACKERQDYLDLVNYWCKEQYTLRYSGGMVPDVSQIILKGKGIFSYPSYNEAPDGKLRLLYECNPMALLMEEAGGAASDGKIRILEKEVKSLDQRTPIFIGSKTEVKRCEEYLS